MVKWSSDINCSCQSFVGTYYEYCLGAANILTRWEETFQGNSSATLISSFFLLLSLSVSVSLSLYLYLSLFSLCLSSFFLFFESLKTQPGFELAG